MVCFSRRKLLELPTVRAHHDVFTIIFFRQRTPGLERSTFVKFLLGGADAKTGTRVSSDWIGVRVHAGALAQQGTTEIGGQVVDAQGAVLPGVNIVITNEDTGATRELISGPEGSYFASQLVPGRYRVAAKLEGFKALDRRGITLDRRTDDDARI